MNQEIEKITSRAPFLEGTYLVSGASGFLASYIVLSLLFYSRINGKEDNIKVIATVRCLRKGREKFGSLLRMSNFRLVEHNNLDKIKLSEKIDYIIHLAGETKKQNFMLFPADTCINNIGGTYHYLELAKEKKIKQFIYVSSVQAYGRVSSVPIYEDDCGGINCMDSSSCYSVSKMMSEELCASYYTQYGIAIKVVRFFHVYGPEELLNNGTFLSEFLNDLLHNKEIVLKGSGKEVRNMCYVTDAITGLFYVLANGKDGEAYNVGSGKNNYTIEEIAELLSNGLKKYGLDTQVRKEKNTIRDTTTSIQAQIPSIEKLSGLGWIEGNEDFIVNIIRVLERKGLLKIQDK